MSVTIGQTEFDRVSYDAEVDVLYLHAGDPGQAVDFDASSEGHALRYDHLDRLVGITILNARSTLEQRGSVTITTPVGPLEASRDQLASALASRAV
jgi:YD repeat-containing protein